MRAERGKRSPVRGRKCVEVKDLSWTEGRDERTVGESDYMRCGFINCHYLSWSNSNSHDATDFHHFGNND